MMFERISKRVASRAAASWLIATLLLAAPAIAWIATSENKHDFLEPFVNPTGAAQTFSTAGHIDADNPFFQALGTGGRTGCAGDRAESGGTITPAGVRGRFEAAAGLDPILRTNDGSSSPNADV